MTEINVQVSVPDDDIILAQIPSEDPIEILITEGTNGLSMTEVRREIDNKIYEHVIDPLPHPAYDEIQDLTLIFKNGLI